MGLMDMLEDGIVSIFIGQNDNDNYTVIGIDGIIAIEYNFKEIPINISADWKPALNLVEHTRFWGDNGAISVRFIF